MSGQAIWDQTIFSIPIDELAVALYDEHVMQDLRSKLKKAGLVSKKQARTAKTEVRKAQKQGEAPKKKGSPADGAPPSSLQQKREKAKAHQQRLNEQRAQQELLAQIRDLIRTHQLADHRGEEHPFHFVGRDNRIRKIMTTRQVSDELSRGRAAIVERDDDPLYDYALVNKKCAEHLATLAPERILFWNKEGPEPEAPSSDPPGP